MQREVQECATFLSKEGDPGPLYAAVEGAGDGREVGGTRSQAIFCHWFAATMIH